MDRKKQSVREHLNRSLNRFERTLPDRKKLIKEELQQRIQDKLGQDL